MRKIKNYYNLSDEQLASAKNDNDAVIFLLQKYKSLVKLKANAYFLPGADKDDIIQEGMIGLYKAIRDFEIEKSPNFRAFADLCVTRQIISAVKAAARKKHIPLNSYISLNAASSSDEYNLTEDAEFSPEDILIDKESNASLSNDLNAMLTNLERNTLNLYLNGKTYKQIAELLSKNKKSVDNALKRVKLKIHKYYTAKNLRKPKNNNLCNT